MEKIDSDIKSKLEKLITTIRGLPIDAKVEIILADIGEELFNKSIVVPIGLFHRNYHKDIDIVEESEYDNHLLQLKINRDSIYDALPEGLFHQPINYKKGEKSKEDILQEIREQKKREVDSRKFFLPIEQELYRVRIALELEEKKCFINPKNIDEQKVFQTFWEIPSFLNFQQKCNMIYLLPIAHHIVGNFHLTELCFESILQNPIGIKNTYPSIQEKNSQFNDDTNSEEQGCLLGNSMLGSDFVLDTQSYRDTLPAILINIGPIPPNEVSSYAKSTVKGKDNGIKRDILEYLINNFIPYDTDTVININIIKPEGFYFSMSESSSFSTIALGMNSVL